MKSSDILSFGEISQNILYIYIYVSTSQKKIIANNDQMSKPHGALGDLWLGGRCQKKLAGGFNPSEKDYIVKLDPFPRDRDLKTPPGC